MDFALGFARFLACGIAVIGGILLAYSAVGLIVLQTAQAREKTVRPN